MKRYMISLLLVLCCLFTAVVPAYAAVNDTGFSDVAADAWYADAVSYVREHGLMSGTSATTFSPNATTTRAMLVTVLYRHAGSPSVQGSNRFPDVTDSAWYHNAVVWAAENGIIGGYSDGRFGGNDPITREQLAAILWRSEGSPSAEGTAAFADQGQISSYAVEAVAWARNEGIVSGMEGNRFAPKGNATRAQMAAMLSRWLSENGTPADGGENQAMPKLNITVNGRSFSATMEDNAASHALLDMLPLTISMNDYSSFEKVGSLGASLPTSNAQTTTHAGDVVLYNGNQIVIFYGSNSWSYTRLAHVDDLTGWADALGSGDVTVTFAAE